MSPVDCGAYPAASNYADTYVDANGATIVSPLTPDQTARYLADVAAFQQCQSAAQGVPLCPLGQYFAGNYSGGTWYGHCVSDYTGQPTTPDVFINAGSAPPGQPLTVPDSVPNTTPAPPVTTPPVVTAPATTPTPAPENTPAPPAGTTAPKPLALVIPDEGDIGAYCDIYPDDPYCVYYTALQNAGVPPASGGVTNITNVQYNAGLLASDVHTIVNDALAGLWGAVVTSVDLAVGSLFSEVQNALTAIGNAVKAAWNILSRLGGLILSFLGQMWYGVLHGLVLAVQDIAGGVKAVYEDVLKPLLGWLQQLRQKILDIWKRFIVPLLVIIQDIRRVLAILGAFHVAFAVKLDQKLGELEAKITQPLLLVLGAVNQVANWMNLIVTAGYLLQKPIWLWSFKAYAGESINLQMNAMNQPLSAAGAAALQGVNGPPTAAQAVSDFNTFVTSTSGPLQDVITQQGANLDAYLTQGI
jgi:hypothetical protein